MKTKVVRLKRLCINSYKRRFNVSIESLSNRTFNLYYIPESKFSFIFCNVAFSIIICQVPIGSFLGSCHVNCFH